MATEPENEKIVSILACPYDTLAVEVAGRVLRCPQGHTFPVVEGIPVMLRDDIGETIHMMSSSLRLARESVEGKARDPWFLDTLGISEQEKLGVRTALARGDGRIDPVVSYLVAHTNGILYRHLVGTLTEYPIPELPLPAGHGEWLLDIGCSWGRWSLAAARKGYRPVGLDPSLGAVLAASRLANALGLPFAGVVGDARSLPFRRHSVGAVHSFSVLQHFSPEDAIRSLREAQRVLAPGGRVIVQMAAAFGVRSLFHQISRGFRTPAGFEVRYWTPQALARTFREIFGDCRMSAAGYFGLGLLADDVHLMPPLHRFVIRASERLKQMAQVFNPLTFVADSLYLRCGD
jgi:SAM-dependent methyltransferase/uncharacterized protein YbaR (Trm112 family)